MANTWTSLLELVYPVGSVYSSYTSTSPATRFGGTWSAITKRFPYYNAGTSTGGSNIHTLTISEMPTHTHSIDHVRVNWYDSGGRGFIGPGTWSDDSANLGVDRSLPQIYNNGGGNAHNNMPAYQTLYAWRRTAQYNYSQLNSISFQN